MPRKRRIPKRREDLPGQLDEWLRFCLDFGYLMGGALSTPEGFLATYDAFRHDLLEGRDPQACWAFWAITYNRAAGLSEEDILRHIAEAQRDFPPREIDQAAFERALGAV